MNLEELEKLVYKSRKKKFKPNLAFIISERITEARIRQGLSQEKLAKLMNTKQPSIARLESGDSLPSLSQLNKVAKALKIELVPPSFKLKPNKKKKMAMKKLELDIEGVRGGVREVAVFQTCHCEE